MRRGEIWTLRGGVFATKARPALVVQSDELDCYETTTVCLLTSADSSGKPARVEIDPSEANGLKHRSWVMADKVYSSWQDELGERIGELTADEMERVSEQLRRVLGL